MNPLDRRIMRKVLIEAAYQNIYFTRMEAFRPQPVFGGLRPRASIRYGGDPDVGESVIRHSSCAAPQRAIAWSGSCDSNHHVYRVKDLKTLAGLIAQHPAAMVLTTEKDAVKLAGGAAKVPAEIRNRLFYQPINISFIDDSATVFFKTLKKMLNQILETPHLSVRRSGSLPRGGDRSRYGSGRFRRHIEVEYAIEYKDIPNFPVSTVEGHKGAPDFRPDRRPPRRGHAGPVPLLRGAHHAAVTFPVRVLKQLGIRCLFVSNASGRHQSVVPYRAT